jgi:uncharacterized protein HemX
MSTEYETSTAASDTQTPPAYEGRGSSKKPVTEKTYNLYLPVLILGLAFLIWTGFQSWQLINENAALNTALQNQEQLVFNSSKMRKSLDAIASETQKLADQGNPNAKLLVDELKKRGVSINTNNPPSP